MQFWNCTFFPILEHCDVCKLVNNKYVKILEKHCINFEITKLGCCKNSPQHNNKSYWNITTSDIKDKFHDFNNSKRYRLFPIVSLFSFRSRSCSNHPKRSQIVITTYSCPSLLQCNVQWRELGVVSYTKKIEKIK